MINHTAIISGDEINQYIPQRPPIQMIDSFFGAEGNTSVSGLTVAGDNIFCQSGALAECGIIEHMAQSGAMHIGYQCISTGKPVQLGYIGAINKLTISRLPLVGEQLRTTITIEAEVFDISQVAAVVAVGDEVIAQCKMKVATPAQ